MKIRETRELSDQFIEKAFIGHMNWVERDRVINIKSEKRIAHLRRASELTMIAVERAPHAQTLFGGRIAVVDL